MKEKTKLGLRVLESALLLGVLGDAMLRATPWGLNLVMWTGALAIALSILLKRAGRRALLAETRWLLAPVVFSAALVAWRDSPMLNSLAIASMLISLSVIAWRAELETNRAWLAGLTEYVSGMLRAGASAVLVGFPFLLVDIEWKEMPHGRWTRHARAVLRGVAIALPLLILFGLLFIAADAVFENLFINVFSLKSEKVLGHALLIVTFAWLTGGFLNVVLLGRREAAQKAEALVPVPATHQSGETVTAIAPEGKQVVARKAPSLGIVEIGVALGLVNALFLGFVLIQLRYFFGGDALVQISSELTYAQYARRGFFELVTVAALVLPLLLIAHWLLRKDNPAHERVFRLLAGGQVALLFVIMASALKRMLLYQSEYGLTEQRLYTTAFMGWLALLFVWFTCTVLRGRREHFSYGAMVAGLLAILMLHVVNPDALIVRANLAHARAGQTFDTVYASSLSADATPALIEALPLLNRNAQCIIIRSLMEQHSRSEQGDWRTWNRARSQALQHTRGRLAAFKELRCYERPEETGGDYNSPPPPPPVFVTHHENGYAMTAYMAIGANRFLGLKKQFIQGAPERYERFLVLLINNRAVAQHSLPDDPGGKSPVYVYKLSDSSFVLRDPYGAYDVAATHMLSTHQKSSKEKLKGELIGVFDDDESRVWRFIPAPEQKRGQKDRIGAHTKDTRSR